jgi:hypothetical protein
VPTESELRDTLRGGAPNNPPRIDTEEVIRKAKARRAPRQVAFGSVAVLAIAGFAVFGASTLPSLLPMSSGTADSAGISGPESAMSDLNGEHSDAPQPDANRVLTSRCGEATDAISPNSMGLVLTTSFPASIPADGQTVSGTATLTNTGASRVQGSTAVEPYLELSRSGITVWHSNGAIPSLGRLVDLAPGESVTYSTRFTPVECSAADESGFPFRENLPKLTSGGVDVVATIQFIPEGATSEAGVLVSGPPETITLH